MNYDALGSISVLAFGAAFLGLNLGLVYFRALLRTAELLAGDRGWLVPAGLTLARVVGAILVLAFMARLGAIALLAAFLGFLLARKIALHSTGSAG